MTDSVDRLGSEGIRSGAQPVPSLTRAQRDALVVLCDLTVTGAAVRLQDVLRVMGHLGHTYREDREGLGIVKRHLNRGHHFGLVHRLWSIETGLTTYRITERGKAVVERLREDDASREAGRADR